eukprot:PhF_6_TR11718/c0_g1_i1/m.19112/K17533/MAP3K19, YSK4; mitogen-activated protein kinase kinase kinase 19
MTEKDKDPMASSTDHLQELQHKYRSIGRAYHLTIPFLFGLMFFALISVAVITYALQKDISDNTLDKVTFAYAEQVYWTQFQTIQGYFSAMEVLTMVPRITVDANFTSVYPDRYWTFRRVLYYLAKSTEVSVYFAEAQVVNWEVWNRTGQYLAWSYGFYQSGIEWDGVQPGYMAEYHVDETTSNLTRKSFNRDYNFTDLEPVVFLAREVEGIGFQTTFIYNDALEAPDVYTGVFRSVHLPNGKIDYYVNIQFSVLNIDDFLSSLRSDFPFEIMLMEVNGDIIGDSEESDRPFLVDSGNVRVLRRTYRESTNELLKHGGAYVHDRLSSSKIVEDTTLDNANKTVFRDRLVLAGIDSYIVFGVLPIRNLKWVMFVVMPVEGVRGQVDKVNQRITIVIITLFVMVFLASFALLVWISRALSSLCTDMAKVSDMNLDGVKEEGILHITELKRIQLSFWIMVHMLKEYRNYLPQALLEGEDTGDMIEEVEEEDNSETDNVKESFTIPKNLQMVTVPPDPEKDMTVQALDSLDASSRGATLEGSMVEQNSAHYDRHHSNVQNRKGSVASMRSSHSDEKDGARENSPSSFFQHGGAPTHTAHATNMSRFHTNLKMRKISCIMLSFPSASKIAHVDQARLHSIGSVVFPHIIRCVEDNEGVIMKVDADGVFICWNAHKSVHNHEKKALNCAINIDDVMRAAVETDDTMENWDWLLCVVSGRAVAGTSGHGRHRSPTVIGDAIDLLHRMEFLTEKYHRTILLTDKVYDATKSLTLLRVIDVLIGTGGVKHYIYQPCSHTVAQLQSYLQGFSSLQMGKYHHAADHFRAHLTSGTNLFPLDLQAARLFKMSVERIPPGRSFIGWSENCDTFDERVDLPEEMVAKMINKASESGNPEVPNSVVSLSLEHRSPIKDKALERMDESRLRQDIEAFRSITSNPTPSDITSSGGGNGHEDDNTSLYTPGPVVPSKVVSKEYIDLRGRRWRRSNKLLGSGAFGEVFLGMGNSGELVALKVIPLKNQAILSGSGNSTGSGQGRRRRVIPKAPSTSLSNPSAAESNPLQDALEEVLREVSLLSELRDENIVGYVGSCVDQGMLVIIIEYIPGGSLQSLLKEFETLEYEATQRYVRDIVRGLVFLHKNDVIHRDVKPHNVLLMIDGQCKLTDFGASAKLGQLENGKVQGTPLYMAPEQCNGNVTKASDIWSVGIVAYQLLTGVLPYPAEMFLGGFNPFMFMYKLGRDPEFHPIYSAEFIEKYPLAKQFCDDVLVRDPTTRPTAEQLLHHPFLL